MRTRSLLLAFHLLTLAGAGLFAQEIETLEEAEPGLRFGIDVGIGTSIPIRGAADDIRYSRSPRITPIVGAMVDAPLGERFRGELIVGYERRSVAMERDVMQSTDPNIPQPVSHMYMADAETERLMIAPAVKFYPTEAFYVGMGAAAGIVASVPEYMNRSVTAPGAGIAMSDFQAFPDLGSGNGLAVDLLTYIGLDLRPTSNTTLQPRLGYAFALTDLYSGVRSHQFRLSVGVLFSP